MRRCVLIIALALALAQTATAGGRSMADVAAYAQRYGIPLAIANALIGQESGGSSDAVSPKGATGITQVMPSTAAGMYGISEDKARVLLHNPDFALDAGMKYLAAQKQAFGTWELALAAYNAGPNAVRKYGGIPPFAETQAYVKSIMAKVNGGDVPLIETTSAPLPITPAPSSSSSPFGLSVEAGLRALGDGTYSPTDMLRSSLGLSPRTTKPTTTFF